MVQFLKISVGVPEHRIKNLRDAKATRDNICQSISDLARCDEIKEGDPILINYAGHGTQAKPPAGWPVAGPESRIQMLVPYDFIPKTTTS